MNLFLAGAAIAGLVGVLIALAAHAPRCDASSPQGEAIGDAQKIDGC